jgi:1-deoxy-D-xylulose-5-phosphate synthase
MIIATPKDSTEAGNILYTATITERPFAIRYSRDKVKYNNKQTYKKIQIGSWEMIEKGKDSILITYGYLLENAKKIREDLKDKIDIGIVNARFQKPIDKSMFNDILDNYKNIYIYEEATFINSLGSYLINYANERGYKGNIKLFAIPDEYVLQGKKSEVLKKLELDPESIEKKIKKTK